MIWRNIFGERKFVVFPHCVPWFFLQKFCQINVLLENFTINWFDVKNLTGSEFLVFPHCAMQIVERRELYSHLKNISWNRRSEFVDFTEFSYKIANVCCASSYLLVKRPLSKQFVNQTVTNPMENSAHFRFTFFFQSQFRNKTEKWESILSWWIWIKTTI